MLRKISFFFFFFFLERGTRQSCGRGDGGLKNNLRISSGSQWVVPGSSKMNESKNHGLGNFWVADEGVNGGGREIVSQKGKKGEEERV